MQDGRQLLFDAAQAQALVTAYNHESYRGCRNIELDRAAYRKFERGLARDEKDLVDQIRFVGEDYGGAQRRFLPHDYIDEARIIASRLSPRIERWKDEVRRCRPLIKEVPVESAVCFLFEPFDATKRWAVWGSKLLHFLRPDAFPILDSHTKRSLGMSSCGTSPRDYCRFCSAFREALIRHREALDAAGKLDVEPPYEDGNRLSPSDLKLLDKILYQRGVEEDRNRRRQSRTRR